MPKQTEQQKELKDLKRDFQEASKRKDREALERLLHDDFTLVDPSGDIVNKEQLIEGIIHPQSTFADNFERNEQKITFFEEGNLVREVADVKIGGNLRGRKVTGDYINTATYIKGPTGWQFAGNTLRKAPATRKGTKTTGKG
jgi:ketosteroid isomerase-like protein